jgi:hypothetical protein
MTDSVKVEMTVALRDLKGKTPAQIACKVKDELHRIYVLGVTKFPTVRISLSEIIINYKIEGKEK